MYANGSSIAPPDERCFAPRLRNHARAPLKLLGRWSFILLSLWLTSCGGGGIAALVAAIVPGASSLPAVAPLLFVAGKEDLPAVILPFTSELRAVVITPDGRKLYAVDSLHDSISVFDLAANDVKTIIDVGSNPNNIALTPDGTRAYVANGGYTNESGNNTVSVIDTNTDQVTTTIAVGENPFGIAVTPNGAKVYIVNRGNSTGNGTVSVVDVGSNAVVDTVAVDKRPSAIVMSPDGTKAYVVNTGSDSVSIIDTVSDQVIATPNVGSEPTNLAITPNGATVYVANEGSNSVSVLDVNNPAAGAQTIPDVGIGPSGIVVSPDGSRAYVANANPLSDNCNTLENTLTVIDVTTNTVIPGASQIEVGKGPLGMVITGNGAKLYSLSACTNTVSVLATALIPTNTAGAVSNIIINGQLRSTGIVISPDSSLVYLAHPNAISTIQVATDNVVGTIPARGRGPTELTAANTPSGPRLYTANSGSDSVSVIDLNTHSWLGTLPVGSRPSYIAVTPNGTKAYVANSGFSRRADDRLSIIDITNNHSVSHLDLNAIGPIRIDISSDGSKAVIAHFGDTFPSDIGAIAAVTILDVTLDQILKQIVTAPKPSDVQITLNNQKALATNSSSKASEVSAIDLTSPNYPFTFITGVKSQPVRVAITSDDQKAVVTNYRDHSTSIINVPLNAVSATVSTGGPNPSAVAITPDNTKAVILNSGDRSYSCGATKCDIGDTVSVLNLNTNGVTNITVGKKPIGVAINANKAYVSNFFGNSVSVINLNTNTVTKTLNVGRAPVGVVSFGSRIYVANSISNTVSVIDVNFDQVIDTIQVNP